ncbi:MAG: hypothetical protein HKN16_00065, partial [Saprospiraceae bacterium]|nr:hypothetical protein [Saprospiraceae bacterium]
FGARPIKRVIQKRVLNELSKQILLKKITPGTPVVLDAFEGKLVFRDPLRKEQKERLIPGEAGKNN